MEAYKRISPDFPERFMGLVEREQTHRHASETTMIQAGVREVQDRASETKRGQWFGLILAMSMMIGSFAMILKGYSVEGLSVLGGTIVTMAGAFVYKQHVRKSVQKPQTKPEPSPQPPVPQTQTPR